MTDPRDPDFDDELFVDLVAALPSEKPPASVHDRLMKSIASESRFERFAQRMSEIMDVTTAAAQSMLDAIDDAAKWAAGALPGVELYHLDGGPRVAHAITGFVRMAPGSVFPEHKHVGDEIVLVIQGAYVDIDGKVYRAGDEHRMPAGSQHSFTAAEGPDLVYLGVVQQGFTVGGYLFGPDSPDA